MGKLPDHIEDDVHRHADAIVRHWKPGAKITVIIRLPGDDTGRMDFITTTDDIDEVEKLILRRRAALERPA